MVVFFFSSRRRHTRCSRDWSSDVCSSDLWNVGWTKSGAIVPEKIDGKYWMYFLGTSADKNDQTGLADRKSTRLNSSHGYISYAVFCLKKKKRHCPPTGDLRIIHHDSSILS